MTKDQLMAMKSRWSEGAKVIDAYLEDSGSFELQDLMTMMCMLLSEILVVLKAMVKPS